MKINFNKSNLCHFAPVNLVKQTKSTKYFLSPHKKHDFLILLGVQNQDGTIKFAKRKKFAQINKFLEIVDQTIDKRSLPHKVTIYDFGCGKSYLTFAIHYYFSKILGKSVFVCGIDCKKNVIKKSNDIAKKLNLKDLVFVESRILEYKIPKIPTIVMSLHACDTATDDALAKGIEAGAKYIFSVPCCYKYIQQNFSSKKFPSQLKQIYSHGILFQRTCDIVTDMFRALILRIKGYKVDAFEFVDSSHSAKNVMIRGILLSNRNISKNLLREYESLKKFWNLIPYLENIIKLK